ncbi:MAG: peptidase M15 [Chlorobiaceae bacterium]|nr:peptidase M15 [Chlorobiaceae bacterium]
MSYMLFSDDVLFFQRILCAEGLYEASLDGKWGPRTEKASKEFERRAEEIRQSTRTFDPRSERCISTLCLKAQKEARLFLGRVIDGGTVARIISGTRSYAEQNALYSKGRFGNPGPRVTNVRGGSSNHNFGIAWDIGIFTPSGGYDEYGSGYDEAAKSGLSPDIEWGGHWKKFVDKPHYQLSRMLSIADLRTRFENGQKLPGLVYC